MTLHVEVIDVPPQPDNPTPANAPLYKIILRDDVEGTQTYVHRNLNQFLLFDEDLRENLAQENFIFPAFPSSTISNKAIPTSSSAISTKISQGVSTKALQRYMQKLVAWYAVDLEQWNGWYEFVVHPEGYRDREDCQNKRQPGLLRTLISCFGSLFTRQNDFVPLDFICRETVSLQVDCLGVFKAILAHQSAIQLVPKAIQDYLDALEEQSQGLIKVVELLDEAVIIRQPLTGFPRPCSLDSVLSVIVNQITTDDEEKEVFLKKDNQTPIFFPPEMVREAERDYEVFVADVVSLVSQADVARQRFITFATENLIDACLDHLADFEGPKVTKAFTLIIL